MNPPAPLQPHTHQHAAAGTPPPRRAPRRRTEQAERVARDPSRLEPGPSALRHVRGEFRPNRPISSDVLRPERLWPGVAVPLDASLDAAAIGRSLVEAHRKGNILRAKRPAHERLARFRHRRTSGRMGGLGNSILGANDEDFEFWLADAPFGPPPPPPQVGVAQVHQLPKPSPGMVTPGAVEVPTNRYRVAAATYSAYQKYPLGYRTARFGVDHDFFWDWWSDWTHISEVDDADASYGLVSSVTDTIKALWQPFWDEREGDNTTMDSFLTCWNLPREWTEYGSHTPLFWRNGGGPARKVYAYALPMILTYRDWVEYTPKYQRGYSAGFAEYLHVLLSGGRPDAPFGDDAHNCPLRIRVANNSSEWDSIMARCDVTDGDCDSGTKPGLNDGTVPWWDFEEYWSTVFHCVTDRAYADLTCELPSTRTNYGASTWIVSGSREIVLHPVKQAFKGMTCDTILHHARFALDYSRYLKNLGAPDEYVDFYRLQAERNARYALRIIADLGELLIHELAHFWRTDAHEGRDCFSTLSGEHWGCHVRAHLGLPANVWYPRGTDLGAAASGMLDDYDSYPGDYMVGRTENGGCVPGSPNRFVSECRIEGYGEPGGKAAYCATGTIEVNGANDTYTTVLKVRGVTVSGTASDLSAWCSDWDGSLAANFD